MPGAPTGPSGPQGLQGPQGPRPCPGPTGPTGPSGTGIPSGTAGFLAVSSQYCIEQFGTNNASGATGPSGGLTNWNAAVTRCAGLDARLCTFGEWNYACRNRVALGLDMGSDYEFLDEISANLGSVAAARTTFDCTQVVSFDADESNSLNWNRSRCCFSR